MKTKFSKRIISLLLSLLMLVTAFPIATVATQAATGDNYLFAYFTGDNDGQRIRFAVSEDGINYTPLYNNAPILSSTAVSETITWNGKQGWSHSKGARDPFIIAKRDSSGNIISGQYYIVATDLRVGKNNGNSYNNSKLLVWDITDISKASSAVPWNIETSGMYGNTYYSGTTLDEHYIAWAPEVTYDYSKNMYMMFWSGPLYASAKLQYVYTNDFKTFYNSNGNVIDGVNYQPEVLYSISGTNTIDGDIVYSNGNYYLVYKKESEGQIYFVKSSTLTGFAGQTATKFVDSNYSGVCFEGPELYQRADGKWVLLVDNYNVNPKSKFVMYVADKLDDFMTGSDFKGKNVTTNINNCFPRHGAVAPITSNDYNALCKAYMIDTSASNMELIAQYFTTSDVTQDATGNGFTLTNQGVTAVGEYNGKSNVAYFSNSTKTSSGSFNYAYLADTSKIYNDYVITPTKGLVFTWEAYDLGNSVSTDYYANFFNLVEDNLGPNGLTYDGTNYNHYAIKHAFLCDGMTAGISNGLSGQDNGNTIYVNENNTGAWHEYKATITKSGLTVYMDGAPYCNYDVEGIDANWFKEMLQGGRLNLGASLFNDPVFNGYMSDFRIYAVMNTDASLADVDTTLAKYETAYKNMVADIKKNHSIYTQLQPAYDAYVKLCKARDAYVYGEDTNVDFKTLTAKLDAAILNMAKWTSPTGNAQPIFGKSGNNENLVTSTDAYSNLLYSQRYDSNGQALFTTTSGTAWNYRKSEFQIGYNSTVMMFDGVTTPSMPIMLMTRFWKGDSWGQSKKSATYTCYPVSSTSNASSELSVLKFASNWKTNKGDDWRFDNAWGGTSGQTGYNSTTYFEGPTFDPNNNKWGNYCQYSNVLKFNKDTSWSTDEYYKDYSSGLSWCYGWSGTGGINSNNPLQNLFGTGSAPVYIVNYKALLDATSTATGNLPATVDNYKQGGLSTYLGYIDAATSYNPNDARTGASSASDVVNNFKTAVTGFITNLGKTSEITSEITSEKIVDNKNYQKLRVEMDKYLADKIGYLDVEVYTAESIAEYNKVLDAAKSLFTYLEGNNYDYSKGYTQGTYAGECADALANILNKKLDLSTLVSNLSAKSIFDGDGNQIYTYESWSTGLSSYVTTYNNLSSQTGEYATDTKKVHNSNGTEIKYQHKNSTNNQTTANNAATAVAGVTLASVDAQACYDNFDASVQVAKTLEQDKYSNYNALESTVTEQTGVVYHTVTEEEANTYNPFSSTKISAGQVLKKSTTGNTDPATTTVLTTANTLTAKDFVTGFFVLDENGDPVNKFGQGNAVTKYGTVYTCRSEKDIPVAWEVQIFDESNDGRDFADTAKIKSNYYSSSVGADLPIKTESNAKVIAKPAYDTAPSSGVALRVYNANNNLIDVIYAADVTTAVNNINVQPDKPFSTFDGWNNPVEVSTGIYYVTPKFVKTNTVEITSPSGTSTVAVNSTVTVHTDDTHYGWAVKTSSGKYQIVAYTTGDYKFVALVNETYVPITFDGTNYYCEGNKLTQGNVDGFTKPAVDKIDAQSYLNSKLTQKSPFVYFQAVDNNSSKLKLYMRVTAGNYADYASRPAEDAFAFGVIINDKKFTVKARNELTGQFYCGFNTSASPYLNTAEGFVTYNYSYSGYGNLATTDTYAYAGSSVSA